MLTQRCTIRRYVITKDAGGGQIKTLSTEWGQWCDVEQLRSNSDTTGQRVVTDGFRLIVRAYSTNPIYVKDEIIVPGWQPGQVRSITVEKVGDIRYYKIECDAIK